MEWGAIGAAILNIALRLFGKRRQGAPAPVQQQSAPVQVTGDNAHIVINYHIYGSEQTVLNRVSGAEHSSLPHASTPPSLGEGFSHDDENTSTEHLEY